MSGGGCAVATHGESPPKPVGPGRGRGMPRPYNGLCRGDPWVARQRRRATSRRRSRASPGGRHTNPKTSEAAGRAAGSAGARRCRTAGEERPRGGTRGSPTIGRPLGRPTTATHTEPPPKPGFARREAHKPKNNGTGRRSAGSASARRSTTARKEGATWGNQGFPHVMRAPVSGVGGRGRRGR
jgi:hypothetical protein